MTRTSLLLVAATVCLNGVSQPFQAQGTRPTAAPKPSFAQPGISPDGSEIAFVSAGDIWVVPARGGDARLLVAHAASEERPLYSPDGSRLAFMSDRSGSMDILILTLSTGQIARLQLDQAALELVPRKVDVLVDRPLGESYTGRDSQLEAAVRELLAQLEATRRARTNAR